MVTGADSDVIEYGLRRPNLCSNAPLYVEKEVNSMEI